MGALLRFGGGVDHLGATLELKAVDIQQRIISGYAAVCSNLDRVGDIIDPAAFTKCLSEKAPGDIAVFIGHKTDTLPVGIPVKLQADGKGLYSETLIKPGPIGDDLLQTAAFLQRHGRSLGMSIGYRTRGSKMERVNGKLVRRLMDVDVAEYSFAASQSIANPEALVVGVKARGKAMAEGSDAAGGATVPEGASEYRIEQRDDGWHVLDEADGDDLGTYDSRAEAETAVAALTREEGEMDDEMPGMGKGKTMDESKAVWTTAFVNDLPDSSFLFIEDGGQKDGDGRTVPRSKRHFPYKDASGKIDLPHLRNAIARIPQSNAPGLNKDALQARAQRLLAAANGGDGKTIDEAPEWQQGAPLTLYGVGCQLHDLADTVAASHKAMTLLGEDTKLGARMQAPMRQKLRDAIQTLTDLANWAETVDAEKDAAAKVAHYQRSLELLALDVA